MSGNGVQCAAATLVCATLGFLPLLARQDPAPAVAEAETQGLEDEPIDPSEYQQQVNLRARLSGIEFLPTDPDVVLARYRIVGGEYDGSVLLLSFSPARPLTLRHWGLHHASGARQIGGGSVSEPAEGQWDPLVPWDTGEPVEWITLTLLLTDLEHGESERPRPYFKTLLGVGPLYPDS